LRSGDFVERKRIVFKKIEKRASRLYLVYDVAGGVARYA